jgi:hypothetical protein
LNGLVTLSKQRSDARARQQRIKRRQADQARQHVDPDGLSHQDRRKLRSETSAQDTAARRRRGAFRHLIIVAAGTVAAMAVVGAAVGLVSAIEASSGQGAAGTFIVGNQLCLNHRVGCMWPGTFRSQNGSTVQHVQYDGTLPPGESSVPAIDPGGGSHTVYPPHGSQAWVGDLLWTVLIGAVVGFLLWISPLGLGRHETGAIV